MTTDPYRHRHRLAGLVVAGGVLFAACGSSSDGAAGADVAAEPALAPGAPDDDTVGVDDVVTTADDDADDVDAASVEVGDTTDTTVAVDDAGGDDASYIGSYTLADDEFGTIVTVTVEDGTRSIETNALPDHETGDFPNAGNPNEISEQDLTWTFTTEPTFTGDATFARTPGVAVNGVKFEPATAETVECSSGDVYRVEALQDLYSLGLDFNNAHVQPTGEYHYHGISELLVEAYDTDDELVLVGFASDGYLMYYSKSGVYESGYTLSDETRSGTDCVASGALGGVDVDVEGTTPDGTYTSDWVWSEGAGDLDSCNGTSIDGEYAYIVTDTFPYVSRCLNGEVAAEAPGGGAPPGGGGPPAGRQPPGA